MEIVFVSAEVSPFSKVGGLGDICGALPKAIRALGHRVLVISPLYATIRPEAHSLARRLSKLQVPLGGTTYALDVYEVRLPSGVDATFLGCPGVFDRNVYGDSDTAPYADNHLRFALLCRGALELCRTRDRATDILHVHEWTTALTAFYLSNLYRQDRKLAGAHTVLTIHNLAYQGLFEKDVLPSLDIPWEEWTPAGVEFWGKLSLLKAGLVNAEVLTTVSPTYARQILTSEHGHGFEGLLRTRRDVLTGILNGVDYSVWNPATDAAIVSRYDAEDSGGKRRCKAELQRQLNLPVRPEAPLIGVVSRYVWQKGFDLFFEIATRVLRQDVQLVALGQGEQATQAAFDDLARRYPDRVASVAGFDDRLAHRIMSAADLYLMPSRYEPSGLTQMYAMRYGALPIVHRTGGLADTVVDADPSGDTGSGFSFEPFEAPALLGAIERALALWGDPPTFARVQHRAMRLDLSWDRSARMYEQIYKELCPGPGE